MRRFFGLLPAVVLAAVSLQGYAVDLTSRKVLLDTGAGKMKMIVMEPEKPSGPVPGILWIHGGGYMTGGSYMVHVSCGKMLAKEYGGVVVSPEYRLASKAPYPAALEDCYAALWWMYHNANSLGIDRSRIVVGGESAGGGLAAALCIYARDKGEIPIALQLPLYPMIDCEDTPSSAHNPGLTWGTSRNHWGWRHYLGEMYGSDCVSKYASAARETDYSGLPPCYTYVLDGEPFRDETLTFVKNLQEAGVEAYVDVYHGNVHAADLLMPWKAASRASKAKLKEMYARFMGF